MNVFRICGCLLCGLYHRAARYMSIPGVHQACHVLSQLFSLLAKPSFSFDTGQSPTVAMTNYTDYPPTPYVSYPSVLTRGTNARTKESLVLTDPPRCTTSFLRRTDLSRSISLMAGTSPRFLPLPAMTRLRQTPQRPVFISPATDLFSDAQTDRFLRCWTVWARCPVETSIYGYYPSLGANAFFVVAFAMCGVLQLTFGIRYKTWTYLIAMMLACVDQSVTFRKV
jgi:hypothetical protein